MTYYTTFGLTLASQFALSLPQLSEGVTPDITIGRNEQHRPPSIHPWDIKGTPERVEFYWMEVGWVTIDSGQNITIDLLEPCGFGVLEDTLLGEALGVALIQRGELLLHAAAVATPDGAIAFCGDSGLGKSTLAFLAQQPGGSVLCDDLCLVRILEGVPHVIPGPPWLKVRDAAMRRIGQRPEDYPIAFEESEKYRVETAQALQPVPLKQLFFLEKGSHLTNTPCPEANAFWALMENSFASHLSQSYEFQFLDSGMEKGLFKLCENLAKSVPCSILSRPHDIPLPSDLQKAGVI